MVHCKFPVVINKMFADFCTFPNFKLLAPVSLVPFLVVTVSTFLPVAVVVVAVSPAIVLGTDEQLLPALLPSQQVADQIVLEEFLPENVRQLGEEEEEGQHVGQPDVVVGHRSVRLRVEAGLVNVTASGLA